MSDCMIIRRGGGGKGFDPNGAVLKVITSTGCTVLVTGTGYSKTHQQADGFPRSGDADVTEHFFSIPASAFGTITVKATNTYGDNTKTITVNTAGKVYEALVSAPNIILDSTFGLQSEYASILAGSLSYNDVYKKITYTGDYDFNGSIFRKYTSHTSDEYVIPVTAYSRIECAARGGRNDSSITLRDKDGNNLAILNTGISGTKSSAIGTKYYPNAGLYAEYLLEISKIVLS